jgi:cysteine desulfurase
MIYLDNHATTPCDPAVIKAMARELRLFVGNPASSHQSGELSSARVQEGMKYIAEIIRGDADEIVITSGATESNNIAILGFANGESEFLRRRKKIVTTKIEHKSVLAPIQHLKELGWEIEYLTLQQDGSVDLEKSAAIIDDKTAIVSIQLANSEIGTIQPVNAIAKLAKSVGAIVHCDAAQAVGKIPINVNDLSIDLLSFCGHKLYGPQGIGALWIHRGLEKFLSPLFFGGGKATMRPGTIPVSLVVGFGRACELAVHNFDEDYKKILGFRNRFEKLLQQSLPRIIINGSNNRLPNNSNITFPQTDAEALLAQAPDIMASTGSACESGSIEPSRVLTAIGIDTEEAFNTIRFGFGRFNTDDEIEIAAEKIVIAYNNVLELTR